MLQVRLHGPNDVRLDDVERPACGAHDVLVAVSRCGICGTDLGYIAAGGVLGPIAAPLPLGHEIAGRVVAVGEAVEDIALGQRVSVNPMAALNMIGNGGPEGGFSELVRVRNARLGDTLHAIPDELDDDMGALIEPLAVGIHAANIGEARPGEPVVVIGAGAIGLAVIAALRARGIDDVVAVDLSRTRLERAERMGARAIVDTSREDFFAAVAALHATDQVFGQPVLGTRLFIDAAGAPEPIESVIRYAGFGARLVVAGVHKHEVGVDFRTVLARELRIQGAIGYPREFPAAIATLRAGSIDVSVLVSHRFALRSFASAFATAARPHDAGKVLITMPELA
jgi:2-desacetyl-2-hydroxyethyl bacteriochlorophyllide A dehydrogenase